MCVNNRVESSLLWLFIIVKQHLHSYIECHCRVRCAKEALLEMVRGVGWRRLNHSLASYHMRNAYISSHINKCRGTPNDAQVEYNKLVRRAKHVKFFSFVYSIRISCSSFVFVLLLMGVIVLFYFYLFWFAQIHFAFLFFQLFYRKCVDVRSHSHAENDKNTGIDWISFALISIYFH